MSLTTAVQTVFVERQLPYRVRQAWDKSCIALGAPEKTITANGLRFRVRRGTCDEAFVQNVVIDREYLRHGLVIRPGDVVLDVGANIGTFAVLAASMGARVIAVEPDPDNLRLLRTNLGLNGLSATIYEAAMGRVSGMVTLHRATAGGGFHTIDAGRFDRDYAEPLTVKAVTLAEVLLGVSRCALLKLDCEGAEFDILDAYLPLDLLHAEIDQIAMEYHSSDPIAVARLLIFAEAMGLMVTHQDVFPTGRGGHLFLSRH